MTVLTAPFYLFIALLIAPVPCERLCHETVKPALILLVSHNGHQFAKLALTAVSTVLQSVPCKLHCGTLSQC